MHVLLTGATGFIGDRLRAALSSSGHEVTGVSRTPSGDQCDWSDESLERGAREADAIVHLAGENLFARRWTPEQKARLVDSRVETTRKLAELAVRHGHRAFVSASAVGYYGPRDEKGLDEDSPPGDDFLAELSRRWEEAGEPAAAGGVRHAVARIGIVLGDDGGALERMLLPFKLGIGGPIGSGRQWMSWIHVDDCVAMLEWLVETETATGPYNATAPNPVTMKEFARSLGRALHRPAVLPVPGFAVRILLGEAADVLLTGQHVLPRRALAEGFSHRYPDLDEALGQILG